MCLWLIHSKTRRPQLLLDRVASPSAGILDENDDRGLQEIGSFLGGFLLRLVLQLDFLIHLFHVATSFKHDLFMTAMIMFINTFIEHYFSPSVSILALNICTI